MATVNPSGAIVAPVYRNPLGASAYIQEPLYKLADLLGDVKAWARHQRMDDLVQAMTEAQALAGCIGAEVHHG